MQILPSTNTQMRNNTDHIDVTDMTTMKKQSTYAKKTGGYHMQADTHTTPRKSIIEL